MIHPILSVQAHYQTYMLKHFKNTKYGKIMKGLHNSHIGESCFIIGNGPSLKAEDLSMLKKKNIDTFAVNRIYKIFSQTDWRPTYYVNTDAVLIRDCLDEVNKIESKMKFIPLQNKYYLEINVDNATYFFRNDIRANDQPEMFSLDCTNQVNMRGTVTIACMQLAMHLGYKNIYLLGIDHNFDKIITESGEIVIDTSVKNYFCDSYDDDVINEVQHDVGTTTRAYMDVKKFIDNTDVKIYNASRQTKLDVFPKVDFDTIISKDFNK